MGLHDNHKTKYSMSLNKGLCRIQYQAIGIAIGFLVIFKKARE